jgi:hypothetical protein
LSVFTANKIEEIGATGSKRDLSPIGGTSHRNDWSGPTHSRQSHGDLSDKARANYDRWSARNRARFAHALQCDDTQLDHSGAIGAYRIVTREKMARRNNT